MRLYGYADPDQVSGTIGTPIDGRMATFEVRADTIVDSGDEKLVEIEISEDGILDGEDVKLTEDGREAIVQALTDWYDVELIADPEYARNLQARIIASEWHGPGTLLAGLSTGGIVAEGLDDEIQSLIDNAETDEDRGRLRSLLAYVRETGPRARVPGWSELSW